MKHLVITLLGIICISCSADSPQNSKEQQVLLKGENETYVIASALEGQIVRNGMPLANAEIIRKLTWNDNKDGIEQIFHTDSEGNFALPTHEEILKLSALTQFTASTQIAVRIGDDTHDIWYNSKLEQELYSETKGPLSQFICDIDEEEIPVFLSNSTVPNILTRCRWENMPTDD